MISGKVVIIVTRVFCRRPQREINLDCNPDDGMEVKDINLERVDTQA